MPIITSPSFSSSSSVVIVIRNGCIWIPASVSLFQKIKAFHVPGLGFDEIEYSNITVPGPVSTISVYSSKFNALINI